MALPTTLQRSRSAVVYLVPETTSGQIAAHPNADGSEAFGLTTVPVIAQAGNYTDTSEIGSELISVDRVLNYMDYATFDLEFYAKPKGQTSGTAMTTSAAAGTQVGSTTTYNVSVTCNSSASVTVGSTVSLSSDHTSANAVNWGGVGAATTALSAGMHKVTAVADGTHFTIQVIGNPGTISLSGGSGTATAKSLTEPPEHAILSKLFGGTRYDSLGTRTTDGTQDANVTKAKASVYSYYLANSVETMTVWSHHQTDTTHQLYTGKGALPTSWSVSMAKDGPLTMSVGFQASKVLYSGTAEVGSTLNAASAPVTVTVGAGAKRYASGTAVASDLFWYESAETIGTKFKVISNDGATEKKTGLTVTAAPSGATFTTGATTSPASGYASDDLLVPDMPTPDCDTTTTIDQRSVQAYLSDESVTMDWEGDDNTSLFHADNALDVTAVSWDFDRGISTPGLTEMTGESFPPASYVINEPSISGSITLLLRPKDFALMNSLRDEPRRAIGVRLGTTDGKIIEIAAKSAHLEVPSATEADGATSIDIPFTVVRGTQCDDEDKFFLRYR